MSEQSHPDPVAAKAARNKRVLIIFGAIAVAIVAIASFVVIKTLSDQRAEEAYAEAVAEFRATQFKNEAVGCSIDPQHFEILDGGESVRFYRAAKYDGASIEEVFCFLDAVGAPESIEGKIGQTRALDGTRSDNWDELEATWTYHPDSGLHLLVERVGEPTLPEAD